MSSCLFLSMLGKSLLSGVLKKKETKKTRERKNSTIFNLFINKKCKLKKIYEWFLVFKRKDTRMKHIHFLWNTKRGILILWKEDISQNYQLMQNDSCHWTVQSNSGTHSENKSIRSRKLVFWLPIQSLIQQPF